MRDTQDLSSTFEGHCFHGRELVQLKYPHSSFDGVEFSGTGSRHRLLDLAKSSTADPSSTIKPSMAQVLSLPHLPWAELYRFLISFHLNVGIK